MAALGVRVTEERKSEEKDWMTVCVGRGGGLWSCSCSVCVWMDSVLSSQEKEGAITGLDRKLKQGLLPVPLLMANVIVNECVRACRLMHKFGFCIFVP